VSARATVRAFPTLLRVGLSSAIAYRGEFLVWMLTTNMPLVMLALWTQVAREAPVGRYGEKEFVAYFLATLIVRLLTSSWVVWEMNMEIREGGLAMRLLRPLHPFFAYAADNLAALPVRALFALPIAGTALFVAGRGELAHDAAHWGIALVGLLGAWAITFNVMLVIGTLGLFWESSLALFELWLGLYFIFSGYLMPLSFFPETLRVATSWMPFRYTLAFPVETMLGMESTEDALRALAAQWAYVAGLLALALFLWRRGLARYAAYGG
jgi:ABC-2 type transport system permease protein